MEVRISLNLDSLFALSLFYGIKILKYKYGNRIKINFIIKCFSLVILLFLFIYYCRIGIRQSINTCPADSDEIINID